MKLACPANPEHKRFSVMAHVTEEWIVDENGDFLEMGSVDVGSVTQRPRVGSDEFHFVCDDCGTDAITKES